MTREKKGKVRFIFDSSAEYNGFCLNRELMQGPDQNNRLLGVLTRFREGEIGFVADMEAKFNSFHLNPERQNYLRFYWFRNNDLSKELVLYRAREHLQKPIQCHFRVETYNKTCFLGLRKQLAFLRRNVYVDDGLGCPCCVSVI